MTSPIQFHAAGITDQGSVRTDNQDQFLVAELVRCMQSVSSSLISKEGSQLTGEPLGQLLVVADGMGGHRAGMEASRFAIQYFIASILNHLGWAYPSNSIDDKSITEDLRELLSRTHNELKLLSEKDPDLAGMGTTFTMAYVVWPRMYIVHAGDTRCYLYREGLLQVLTRDHTVADQLMKTGRLSPDLTYRSPWSNVLVNALGAGADDVHADVSIMDLQEEDLVLLCSDGLNKHVDDSQILNTLRRELEPKELCESLLKQAKDDGGSDNVTAIAARWRRTGQQLGMPIHQSTQSDSALLQEIPRPVEETGTEDLGTINFSTIEIRDFPTEPFEG